MCAPDASDTERREGTSPSPPSWSGGSEGDQGRRGSATCYRACFGVGRGWRTERDKRPLLMPPATTRGAREKGARAIERLFLRRRSGSACREIGWRGRPRRREGGVGVKGTSFHRTVSFLLFFERPHPRHRRACLFIHSRIDFKKRHAGFESLDEVGKRAVFSSPCPSKDDGC